MFRNRNVESNRIGRGCLRTVDAHDLLPTNWLDSEGIDDLCVTLVIVAPVSNRAVNDL